MADSQSIIALNIGSQRISMGVFAQTKKGLVLKSQGATSILADPATEAARIPQVQLAITELAKSLKLAKQKTAYALSGQSVFVRFVKLPPLESEDVGELVRFEAQQNVPFPIDEVVWDWEALKGGGIETEVVLVAIKSDSLNDLNEVVAETGLGTRLVDAAPTALYNALRYNYPDLTESTLLLDVGAKTSNLIYAEGEKFFTRSVPVGGSSLTSAIAKDYNVSFAEAENTKLTAGLVLLGGGHASQLDEATAALGTVIRNGLTRLTAEVARTTQLFRSQHGGSAPTKVLLAGGGANLPYMKEFLEEKLNLPVEIFNPLQRISVGKGVDVEALGAQAHMLGEIVGLGLRASDKATINIDLVPDVVQAERDITRRKPTLIAAAALFLGGLALWPVFNILTASKGEAAIKNAIAEEETLTGPAKELERIYKNEKATSTILNSYAAAENGRLSLVDFVDSISGHMVSEKVWITDLEPRADYAPVLDEGNVPIISEGFPISPYGKDVFLPKESTEANCVVIRGFCRSNRNDVLALVANLRKSEYLDFTWDGKELSEGQIVKTIEAAPEDGNYAAPFEIIVPLKTPISLK
ncbi:type IV pilus assembly protein PilM [bacterium]|nr:type IV pilus assembly protein PilM [Akkermansiaceae bacterium]MDB4418841.1 type IV pilus assembly protein PilM [bacterium]MDB4522360.1 type IV pilus assembly protein PilM [bacterium]MDB4562254.1 type IV pilus assembly protein PilM [Akkermansiaceae bacterium]MDB4725253.1 type IV pilus assembly protein PilM [Akkermansiaceae bacterium]